MSGPYFSEDGSLVEAVDFQFPDEKSEDTSDDRRLWLEVLNRVVSLLDCGRPLESGRKVAVMSYLIGSSPFKNQSELAKTLGLTEGRISQLLKTLRAEVSQLRH